MKHEIRTTIEIEAPAEIVWDILTDIEAYSEWNPFIVSAVGQVAVGERLTNRLQPPGGKAMTFKPTITELDRAHTFEWLGRLGLPGIFDGRHRFELRLADGGGTRLLHSERVTGVLVRFLRKSLDTKTLAGFEAMNTALKTRAEASVGSES